MRHRRFGFYLLCLALFLCAHSRTVVGQRGQFQIDYTVEVSNPQSRLFHVTANIKNIRQSRLDLSLPTWTPGWYKIENYAKNILRFRITDAKGTPLPHILVRKQTWSVETSHLDGLRVEFDYRADTLGLNQAKIAKDFAFFTGTELFLMAEGHRASPCEVRFILPKDWKIISALKETTDPLAFTAPDYDTLVDAPTELGHFDVTRFEVEGKPHYFVAIPAGSFSTQKTEKMVGLLTKIASTQSAIFGGLPYEKFVYFYFFTPPETSSSGALEHSSSYVSFAPSGESDTPDTLVDIAAHEFFHLWNVKRIRPVEMWPYDYSRENETPSLWVSEGLTNYYGSLSLYRAGLHSSKEFLDGVAGAIRGVESREARAYISPAESSASTWFTDDGPTSYGISYYTQGQNLGALLDLSIRHDTGGKASLDDVMRMLYNEFYRKSKGFSTEDMIDIINRLTGRDYHDFFRQYVLGVFVPPYNSIFGYAGYRVEKIVREVPQLGVDVKIEPGQMRITGIKPGTPAVNADLSVGDLILKVDGEDTSHINLKGKIGRTIKLSIRRDGEDKVVEMKVGSREDVSYSIMDLPEPTAEQLKIREGWLKIASELKKTD